MVPVNSSLLIMVNKMERAPGAGLPKNGSPDLHPSDPHKKKARGTESAAGLMILSFAGPQKQSRNKAFVFSSVIFTGLPPQLGSSIAMEVSSSTRSDLMPMAVRFSGTPSSARSDRT